MKSIGRQTLLLLLLALLGLSSAKLSAQSTGTEGTAYAQIEDYANILFFAGSQEPAIGYLYYLYDAYPDQQVRTAVPLASWLDLADRQSEARDLLQTLFTRKSDQAHANQELVRYYLTLLYSSGEINEADSLFAMLPREVSSHPDILLVHLTSLAILNKSQELLEQIAQLDTTQLTNTQQRETYYRLITQSASKQGDYQRMLQAAERLVELEPSNLGNHHTRLEALNALRLDDQIEKGLVQLQRTLSLPDDYIEVTRAELIAARRDTKQSAEYLHRYLERQDSISPVSARIISMMLPDFSDISQIPSDFIPALTRLAELEPSDPKLFADLYLIVLAQQGKAQAEQLIKQFYDNPKTAYSAVVVQASQMKEQERLDYLTSAQKRYPADLQILALYAGELIARDRLDEAKQAINSQLDWTKLKTAKGVEATEGVRLLLLYSSLIYEKQEQSAQALEVFEIAERLFPRDAILLNNYAYYLYTLSPQDSSYLVKAEQLAATAYGLAPEEANILDTYGTILLARGQTTMAQLMLSQAVERAEQIGKPNAGYIERLGDAYLQGGDRQAALQQWQRAYKLAPTEGLQQKIDALTP
ncbi:hypothetical protein [uncultured Porphyromonas sp.]|uniref:tetratricopeptide repeat protein n=1 Tax=uncultured Porphyromonas sp. TaxID=159274 RepID=UPI0028060123|nr:hypothetical protein [uncultured Porphyromonas sp.]